MKLGDAIKLIRTAKKRKQVDLAEKIGVSPNYISMVEANKKVPSLEVLEKFASELEVPAGLFLLWADSDRTNAKPAQARKLRDLLVRIQAIYLEGEDQEVPKRPQKAKRNESAA